MTIKG